LKDQIKNQKFSYKNQVCLGLGSNIDPERNILKAVELLQNIFHLAGISSAWESFPVGSNGPKFINAALNFNTDLNLDKLKREFLIPVEAQLGRVRTSDKYAPRTIDLDVLIWNEEIVDPELVKLPHLAVPVAELSPGFRPFRGTETIEEIAGVLNSNKALVFCPEISQKLRELFRS